MRVPVRLVTVPALCRTVAALNGALLALCVTFPVLGGLCRRSMELSQHSVGHSLCSAGCGGAQWSSPSTLWDSPCARRIVAALNGALPPLCGTFRTGGPETQQRLESGSSRSDAVHAPPQSAPCCDNPAISTNTDCGHASSTIALTEKMETVNTFNTVKPKILREFKLLQ